MRLTSHPLSCPALPVAIVTDTQRITSPVVCALVGNEPRSKRRSSFRHYLDLAFLLPPNGRDPLLPHLPHHHNMTVAIELNTPLADALNSAIQPKLEEHGWATGGADDAALSEYIILMLVNNKTHDEVAQELSTDLLGLDPNDQGLRDFCSWLFATVDSLSAQASVSQAQSDVATDAPQGAPDADQDMDMTTTDGPTELNAYASTAILFSMPNDAMILTFSQTHRSQSHA